MWSIFGWQILVQSLPLPRRISFFAAGVFAFLLVPSKSEGGEAPTGAGAERRTPWPALRSGRSLQRKGSPANNVGRRAFRRFTAAFQKRLSDRLTVPGRASSSGHLRPGVQPAPRRRLVVPNGRSPGTARVRRSATPYARGGRTGRLFRISPVHRHQAEGFVPHLRPFPSVRPALARFVKAPLNGRGSDSILS